MKHLRGDLGSIPNIGSHPGVECANCGMKPFYGERFSCIECGGGTYDLDSDSLLSKESEQSFDPSVYNLCCFCYADRVHDPEHHYIVYIDNNLICESQLNSYRNPQPNKTPSNFTESNPDTTGWCSVL